MQIGIKGCDYVYLWNVRKNKQNKIFFRIKDQMYQVYPSELRRMRINKYGESAGTDAVIIFTEECLQPYHPKDMSYNQDDILMAIDSRKFTYKSKIKGRIWDKFGNFNAWWPVLVIGIALAAVGFTFLGS